MLWFLTPSLTLGALVTSVYACTGPAANQATVDLVKDFEKFRSLPYTDATGHPTIGYGHLCRTATCSDVKFPQPLSEADGERVLKQDLKVAQDCIATATGSGVTINANQYGAIVSWAFNVGCPAARSSTLIRRLNRDESPRTVISEELPKWNKGNGKVLPGLVRRRRAEVELAEKPTSDPGLPAAGC